MTRPHVVVVGGGLAGLTAALHCADAGARVTVVERRRRLGGLTWSFDHDGLSVDNGQHVFLRCCEAYLGFLERIGSAGDVTLQDRLDITVIRPGRPGEGRRQPTEGRHGHPQQGRITRNNLPAPAHLAASLLTYPLLSVAERARLGRAVLALRRLDLNDPALDEQTFGSWLAAHGQSDAAVAALWDLITVATVNLPASEASLAMGAKVFQTGLLTEAAAADIGWSNIPLGVLHGERAAGALDRVGADVTYGEKVTRIDPVDPGPGFAVRTETGTLDADSVVVALPHHAVGAVLPPGTAARQDRLHELGSSAIVDVHLTYDRRITDLPFLAGVDTPLQWLFDRTASSGLAPPGPGSPQYLAVSLSAADDAMGRRPDDLIAEVTRELPRLLPAAAGARLTGSLVTKERAATFRAVPGTASLRSPSRTRIPGLWLAGAWTDTGWPATMEGACRSGRTAARGALVDAGRVHRLSEEVA